MNVLFVNQGRATPQETVGPLTIPSSIALGLSHVQDEALTPTYVELPPFNRWHRQLLRPVKRWDRLNLLSLRWHLVRSMSAREAILDHLYLSQPDVVHITNSHISFLLRRVQRRVPCVLSLDTLVVDWARAKRFVPANASTPPFLQPLVPLERRALQDAPLNIAYTATVARRINEFAPGARVATVHPGLDIEAFQPSKRRGRKGPRRVLFVGARWETKGGPELLAALGPRLGRDVELDVVTQQPVEALDGVRFHKAQPGSSLITELFGRADAFCLPTWVDAVPWVVLEAMASGVPVVSTRVGSIPEMVGDAGLICDAGDSSGLRDALDTLIDDPARRKAMGEAGRLRVEEHYDARKTTPQLVELLRDVARAAR